MGFYVISTSGRNLKLTYFQYNKISRYARNDSFAEFSDSLLKVLRRIGREGQRHYLRQDRLTLHKKSQVGLRRCYLRGCSWGQEHAWGNAQSLKWSTKSPGDRRWRKSSNWLWRDMRRVKFTGGGIWAFKMVRKVVSEENSQDKIIRERMADEVLVKERIDEEGNRWTKVYFGGGEHFKGRLAQCKP